MGGPDPATASSTRTETPMTDTIPAEKVQEVIDFLTAHAKMEESDDYGIGYTNAIENCLSMIHGIVRLPPALLQTNYGNTLMLITSPITVCRSLNPSLIVWRPSRKNATRVTGL